MPRGFGLTVKMPRFGRDPQGNLKNDGVQGKMRRFAYFSSDERPLAELIGTALPTLERSIRELAERVDAEARRCRARLFLEWGEAILKDTVDPSTWSGQTLARTSVAVKVWGISAGSWRKAR